MASKRIKNCKDVYHKKKVKFIFPIYIYAHIYFKLSNHTLTLDLKKKKKT